jgi:hypothetical protein
VCRDTVDPFLNVFFLSSEREFFLGCAHWRSLVMTKLDCCISSLFHVLDLICNIE